MHSTITSFHTGLIELKTACCGPALGFISVDKYKQALPALQHVHKKRASVATGPFIGALLLRLA